MEHIDHILVVDDDRDIRELIVDYLVKSGYHASGAANGKEMRVVLDKQHIDLVVLDVIAVGRDSAVAQGSAFLIRLTEPAEPP